MLPRPGIRALDGSVDELVNKPVVPVSEDDLRKNLTNPAHTPASGAWGAEAKVCAVGSIAPHRCSLQCRRSCRSSVMGWVYGCPEAGSAPIQQRAGPARLQQAAEQRLIGAPTVARLGGARALARLSPGWI